MRIPAFLSEASRDEVARILLPRADGSLVREVRDGDAEPISSTRALGGSQAAAQPARTWPGAMAS
jgi:hypothetical protein